MTRVQSNTGKNLDELKKYKDDFLSVTPTDVHEGDIVYIDNFEDGKYPDATPVISGPFTVRKKHNKFLTLHGPTHKQDHLQGEFRHNYYNDNLLVKRT